MMKKIFTIILFLCASVAVSAADGDIFFSKETFRSGTTILPYRRAMINGDPTGVIKPALVIYLHGGSSKGDDNVKQMLEPGIDSISNYIESHGIPAIFLVPQCPATGSWGGQMLEVVKALLESYIDDGVVDEDKVYAFGGSMGGTGTWTLASMYPELFAAVMPVAGSTNKSNAEAIAHTPVYTVMGLADNLMKIDVVRTFLDEVLRLGGEFRFDTEEGWSHEMTCIQSYTTQRLDWVFSHVRNGESSVSSVVQNDKVAEAVWYTIDGRRISSSYNKGLYITRGKKVIK